MKKVLLIFAASTMLITFGCKKSDKNGPIVDTSPTGVAQNKKTLDAQSSQLGAEITSMSDTKVATLFKSSPITKLKSGGGVLNSNLPIIKFIKTLSTGKATKESLLKVMKSGANLKKWTAKTTARCSRKRPAANL